MSLGIDCAAGFEVGEQQRFESVDQGDVEFGAVEEGQFFDRGVVAVAGGEEGREEFGEVVDVVFVVFEGGEEVGRVHRWEISGEQRESSVVGESLGDSLVFGTCRLCSAILTLTLILCRRYGAARA